MNQKSITRKDKKKIVWRHLEKKRRLRDSVDFKLTPCKLI